MSMKRASGVGGREPEIKFPDDKTLTPDPRLPTPGNLNWRLIYSAVLIELALLIVVFYAFTKAFS